MSRLQVGGTHEDRDGNLWKLRCEKWYVWKDSKWHEFFMIGNIHKFRQAFGIVRL